MWLLGQLRLSELAHGILVVASRASHSPVVVGPAAVLTVYAHVLGERQTIEALNHLNELTSGPSGHS